MTTWDVRDNRGQVITDLAGLATALGVTEAKAARAVLGDAVMLAAAPAGLLTEVKAATKPGGGTPPPISNGSFVSFRGGKGRVDLLVSKGKVPGVTDDVEATSDSPAARVVVWKDGKATREKRGFNTHMLKRIAPLDRQGEAKSLSSPSARLVSLVAQHDAKCTALGLPDFRRVSGAAVKSVYDRGVEAWPGRSVSGVTREEWALGRAEYFVKVASGGGVEPGHDVDLLHPEHPLRATLVPFDLGQHNETLRRLRSV